MPKRIGLVVGHEPELVATLSERLAREVDVEVGLVSMGGTTERHLGRWDAMVDRMSTRVPHYRLRLKAERLAGTAVLNDPFLASALDGFSALSLVARAGAPVPPMILLPQKSYGPLVLPERDLGNLEFPLPWDAIAAHVGFPAVLRTASDGRLLGTIREPQGLLSAFDHSGDVPLVVQRALEGREVRALVAGDVVVLDGDEQLSEAERRAADDTARVVADVIGYELSAVRLVIDGGIAHVLAADDPAPLLDPVSLGARFGLLVDGLARALLKAARHGPRPLPIGQFGAPSG